MRKQAETPCTSGAVFGDFPGRENATNCYGYSRRWTKSRNTLPKQQSRTRRKTTRRVHVRLAFRTFGLFRMAAYQRGDLLPLGEIFFPPTNTIRIP